jgi:hypothetical protein
MRLDSRFKALAPAIGLAVVLAASAPTAQADPTRVTGGGEQSNNYQLRAAPGTTNNISVRVQPSTGGFFDYVFSDTAGLVTPLFLSCQAPDGSNAAEGVHDTLICGAPIFEPFEDFTVRAEAGDGDDTVSVDFGQTPSFGKVAQNIKGEEGNDTLIGNGPAALDTFIEPLLDGGPGNDVLRSGGNHKIKGRGGIDRIFARNGIRNLKINCGSGSNKRESAKVDGKDPKAKSC